MHTYLIQVAYNPEGWANLVKQPQNRIEAIRPSVEKLGGKIVGGWFAFGEHDVVAIANLPDNTAAAALSIAFGAGGAVRHSQVTPLITPEEAVDAMRKASTAGYKAAGH